MKHKGSFLLTLLILFFLLVVLYLSLGYRPKAKLVPLIVAVPTVVITIRQVLKEKTLLSMPEDSRAEDAEKSDGYGVILWAVALLVMLFALGFLVALPLFTFLYLKIKGRRNVLASAGVSLGFCGAIYAAFVLGLNIRFFTGALFKFL